MKVRQLSILAILLFLGNCASRGPLITKYPMPPQELDVTSDDPGKVRVIMFNTSGGLTHGFDNTGGLKVLVDSVVVGFIDMKEYAVLFMTPGKHRLNLSHWDVWNMKSQFEIEVPNKNSLLRVYAKKLSNGYEFVDKLPSEFHTRYRKFKIKLESELP